MPIYEYRCGACAKVSSIFLRSASSEVKAACEHCGSKRLKRVMSRVARLRSTSDVIDEFGVPSSDSGIRDPRQIGSWVEKRFEEYGMDLPEETRAMIDAAREGELPGGIDDL